MNILALGGALPLLASLFLFSFDAFGQVPTCVPGATSTVVRAEGLTEQIGNLTLTCTGGTANSPASITLFVGLSVNMTNRLNADGSPQGITVTVNSVPQTIQQQLYS